jgi:predicted nucleotidyltransferase
MSVFGGTSLTDSDIYSAVALHVIRASDEETLSTYFGMNGGVSGLIKNRAEEVNDVDELVSACTGKSYTSARIRRTILSAVLKITESDVRSTPSFTTLLAANERGRAVLHRIKKTSCIPIISKVADGMSDPDVSDALSISLRADKLMALCRHEPSGTVFKTTPVII